MIWQLQSQSKADYIDISLSRLCRWFGVPRRLIDYRPQRKPATTQEQYVQPIKQLIEVEPSLGYRTVAALLDMNKNTVQRVFQLKSWQVRKRAVERSPHIQAMLSKAQEPNKASPQICTGVGVG